MIPCQPAHPCGQRDRCARFGAAGQDAIDASVSVTSRQAWCPMFIDRRGLRLISLEDTTMPMIPAATGRKAVQMPEVLNMIERAGKSGRSTMELRSRLEHIGKRSIHTACTSLHAQGYVHRMQSRQLVVYYAADVSEGDRQADFQSRCAKRDAAQAQAQRDSVARYRAANAILEKACRQQRKAEAERLRAEHRAKVEQARLDREAQRQAERDRLAKLQASKRAEIALNNRLAKKIKGDGTHRPSAERQPEPAPPTITWGAGVKHTISKAPPGRYEVLEAIGPFGSMKPGQYAFEASSCAAKRLEAA